MSTKLGLYQGAHIILGENAVDMTVTDDSAFVNSLDVVYDRVLAHCLAAGDWNHATRTVSIEASEDVSSSFGYTTVIVKPDDYAGRIVSLSGNELFDPPLDDYHEEGGLEGYIYCHIDPLYLRYISNGVAYGLNLAAWPPAFELYVEHELAFRVARQLTTMSAAEKEELRKERNRALRDAKAKDARNQGTQWLPQGRLVQSRGWPSTRSRWRY